MQSISFSALKEEELKLYALSNQALPEFFKAQSFSWEDIVFFRPRLFLPTLGQKFSYEQ